MKRKILFIFLLILITGCSYDPYEMPKDAYINSNDVTYEVYDINAKLFDLIGDNNVDIISKDKNISTKKLGSNKVTIKYKYKRKRREYKYDITYKVIDTTKPIFLSADENITMLKGEEKDFCEKINIADNYDNDVKCNIEGNIDINTVGKYNLKYVITDNSDNKDEKDFTVNVVEKINSYSGGSSNYTTPKRLEFSDVIRNYKTDDNMIGIDVSYWQKNIDFEKVKNAGCEFVIIRIGVNSNIDKDISVDSFYEKNIKAAKKAGLKVGVYAYTTAINEDMAKEHAKWILKTLNKEKLDFPVAFDWENWDSFRSYKISMYDLTNTYLTFQKELKKEGYDAMLYSSMNYLNKIWMFNDTYPVWLAHYTDKTTYEGKYMMWQMSSNGKIDGITGNVDIDIYYKGVDYE